MVIARSSSAGPSHLLVSYLATMLSLGCDLPVPDGDDDGTDDMDGADDMDSADDPGSTEAPTVPEPIGTCPTFLDGTLEFRPDPTGKTRSARVWMDEDAALGTDGPVVFYWYGTFGNPEQAIEALGLDGIERITSMGGIVVAPTHVNAGTFPWITDQGLIDFALTDEVLGCAEREIGIDETRIHSLGFSAGALFTSGLSFARSSYIASVATYSGGGTGTFEDPSNKFAALVLHGGIEDNVFGQDFVKSSDEYRETLEANGNFVLQCDHGQGHNIAQAAAPGVVQFLLDHPWGTQPSPYAEGMLPDAVAQVCGS